MFVLSPFLGISLIIAVLKFCVRVPRVKAILAYFKSGALNIYQNLFINEVIIPSIPAADLQFAPSKEMSSSSRVSSASSRILSLSDNLRFRVKG
jgi:hypothetical protein